METNSTTPAQCGRTDCRKPATTRRVMKSPSGRTWDNVYCTPDHAVPGDTFTALGFTVISTEQLMTA